MPNGTHKRQICCRREGAVIVETAPQKPTKVERARRETVTVAPAKRTLQVGDVVPLPKRKLDVRPAFTGAGASSFKAARAPKRLGK